LVQYLIDENINLESKRILEVGCGHGIPGLYCLLTSNNATVHFQDYNDEVIKFLTMPNVLINDANNNILSRASFFSGDWYHLEQFLSNQRYDLILTSDTLYSSQSHNKLYSFIKNLLKPDGEIYIAAKTYYFGCGGGVRQFESMVNNKKEMKIETVRKIADGQSNMREILLMKHLY
jgi:SAM-dependent methyltransferase